jgi:hypothetical protein
MARKIRLIQSNLDIMTMRYFPLAISLEKQIKSDRYLITELQFLSAMTINWLSTNRILPFRSSNGLPHHLIRGEAAFYCKLASRRRTRTDRIKNDCDEDGEWLGVSVLLCL